MQSQKRREKTDLRKKQNKNNSNSSRDEMRMKIKQMVWSHQNVHIWDNDFFEKLRNSQARIVLPEIENNRMHTTIITISIASPLTTKFLSILFSLFVYACIWFYSI